MMRERIVLRGQWFCAQTYYKREEEVVLRYEQQGFVALLPKQREWNHKEGTWQKVLMFPGYVFVRFRPDVDRWKPLINTIGVQRFFLLGDQPIPIPFAAMQEIIRASLPQPRQRQIYDEMLAQHDGPMFSAGDAVTAKDGAWHGFVGIVEKVASDRVKVLLSIFGRESSITFPAAAIEKAAQPCG